MRAPPVPACHRPQGGSTRAGGGVTLHRLLTIPRSGAADRARRSRPPRRPCPCCPAGASTPGCAAAAPASRGACRRRGSLRRVCHACRQTPSRLRSGTARTRESCSRTRSRRCRLPRNSWAGPGPPPRASNSRGSTSCSGRTRSRSSPSHETARPICAARRSGPLAPEEQAFCHSTR